MFPLYKISQLSFFPLTNDESINFNIFIRDKNFLKIYFQHISPYLNYYLAKPSKTVQRKAENIPFLYSLYWIGTPESDSMKMRSQAILETISNGIAGIGNPIPP